MFYTLYKCNQVNIWMKFLLTLVFLVACTAPCRDAPHRTSSGLFLYCNCLNSKHPLNVDIAPVEPGHDTNALSPVTVPRFQPKTISEDDGKWKQQKHVKWDFKKECVISWVRVENPGVGGVDTLAE